MDGMSDIRNEIEQRLGVFARQGAKSEMQKEYVLWGLPKGKTDAIHEQILSTKAKTPAEMDAIKRRAAADGWHSFRVQILDLSKPYKGFGFSRPGAKAEFAVDAGAIAKEILRQLGGGRFMSMVGGKNAFHGNFGGKPGLQVDIGKGAQGGINRLIVTLDPASDTYNMEFWRIAKGGLSTKKVSEASGVYADDLQRVFTDRTKFYTSMSRPGAKATMGRAEDLYRKLSSGSITYANAKEWDRLVTEALRLPDYTPPGGDMSLHEIAEDLGGELMALKTHRGPVPNAKATAAKPNDKTECADCETEQDKAGLKLMEKADKAVSDKIRTLIKEGKPQDQAVAIALDMKRRGEI